MTNADMHAGETARQLDIIPLADFNGEPRARDVDIGEKLGFANPAMIRKLIARHRPALEGFGVVSTVEKTGGARGGRPGVENWLNERQALYIAAKSDAPAADKVLTVLVSVFVAWRDGHLGGILSAADVERIMDGRLASFLPALIDAASMKVQFGVTRDTVTAGQVLDIAKVPSKGRRGLILRVSNALRRHCARVNIAPREAVLGATTAYVFPTKTAREWLDHDGRDLIKRYLDEKSGQTVVKLVGKAEGQEHRKPL